MPVEISAPHALLEEVREAAHPLTGAANDHDLLLERIGDASVVLLDERQSHYFHVQLADQFDAVLHLDETRALEPLEREPAWVAGEAPATFPTGV